MDVSLLEAVKGFVWPLGWSIHAHESEKPFASVLYCVPRFWTPCNMLEVEYGNKQAEPNRSTKSEYACWRVWPQVHDP